jgi:hypothetical protein
MRNNKGVAEVIVLYYVLAALALLFIPNPLSSSMGVGIKPNKTIQTEKVELIKDVQGNPIAYKTTTSDKDIQQKVSFWEWFRSLPVLIIVLCWAGFVFPPVALFFGWLWSNAKKGMKQIVTGVEEAKKTLAPDAIKTLETNLSKKMDTPVKAEVKKIKVGL